MTWLHVFEFTVLGYFLVLNGVYLSLNILSLNGIYRYMQGSRVRGIPRIFAGFAPPISIVIPAYNEEDTIISTLQSILEIDYPRFEIIIVNDGSTDETLAILTRELALVPFPEAYRARLETKPIRRIFRSIKMPRIYVIDKENGDKADAMNAGVNMAHYPLFCAVDADCILQRDSLLRIVQPFLEDDKTVAVGGTLRVLNGCKREGHRLIEPRVSSNFFALFQTIEYLRAFLYGRMGWVPLNSVLIVSGAFGLFRKETFMSVGGYRKECWGEDMELIVRMHRLLRKKRIPYRITFIPDPICWTMVPDNYRDLARQRIRWHLGHIQALVKNIGLMFSRRGGVVGWIAFPFSLIFEWFGPIIEFIGYIVMTAGFYYGWITLDIFQVFLLVAIGFGILLSVSSLLLEELSFHVYPKPIHVIALFAAAVLENFGYRQLNTVWRVYAVGKFLLGGYIKNPPKLSPKPSAASKSVASK